jgi:imidazolonepropionase-like amidohydrolase
MAEHGVYFDPNTDLVFRNYFEHKSQFLGTGSYTEEGFAAMAKAVPRVLEVFKKAIRTKGLKVVFGTDALAGSHGRNFQELEYRVRT